LSWHRRPAEAPPQSGLPQLVGLLAEARIEADRKAQSGPGTMPRAVGGILQAAVLRAAFPNQTYAAKALGLKPDYLRKLIKGVARPSISLARSLIDGLDLDELEAALLLFYSVKGKGRDNLPAIDPP
jgi:hypothetical protein